MISVCIACAAWRRPQITRLTLMQRQRLCAELAARGIDATMLVAADDENLDIAAEYGAETLVISNKLLGHKCNELLRAAGARADWVVWIGSDDWIHADVFDVLTRDEPIPPGTIFTGHRLVTVDMPTGRLQRLNSPSKFGAIPWLLDARLLRNDGDWIRKDIPRGLDGALITGLKICRLRPEFESHDPHEFRCVDFKTQDNLTPYDLFVDRLGYGDPGDPGTAWDELRGWYADDLVDHARDVAAAI